MLVHLVYDEDCLCWGLPETCCMLYVLCCVLLVIFFQLCFRYSYEFLHLTSLWLVLLSCQTICLSLSMVSGHEALSLWPETSPLKSLCWNIFVRHQCRASFLWLVLLLYWNYLLGWRPLHWVIFYSVWHHGVFWVREPFFALSRLCQQLCVHCSCFWLPLQLWILLLGGIIYLPLRHVLWDYQLYIFFIHFIFGILNRSIPLCIMYTSYMFGILITAPLNCTTLFTHFWYAVDCFLYIVSCTFSLRYLGLF